MSQKMIMQCRKRDDPSLEVGKPRTESRQVFAKKKHIQTLERQPAPNFQRLGT